MATTTRRAVLGATGAVIAAGLAGGVPLVAQGRGPGRMKKLLETELAGAVGDLKATRPGAQARAAAAITWSAAWLESEDLDAQVQARLRKEIRKGGGIDALASRVASFDYSTLGLPQPPLMTPTEAKAALEEMLAHGVSAGTQRLADLVRTGPAIQIQSVATMRQCGYGWQIGRLFGATEVFVFSLFFPEAAIVVGGAMIAYSWYGALVYGC